MLKFTTAGESHGQAYAVIIEGIPANMPISMNAISLEMQKRRKDFGRGGRGEMEGDEVEIISGIKNNKTIGSPIALLIKNKDFKNWENTSAPLVKPRPGHADLAGMLKFGFKDARNVAERASARETAARVAAGSIFKQFLSAFGIEIASHVVKIGNISLKTHYSFDQIKKVYKKNPEIRCIDAKTSAKMKEAVLKARKRKDTLGGVLEIQAINVPAGLGSYVGFQKRINGQIAQSLMSIPSVKAVEIGNGIENASRYGSKVHDIILHKSNKGFLRKTNNAGGIEGGMTNGMPIIVRVYHKPIPTLYNPLDTIDVRTRKASKADIERSDVCVVPRAGAVSESMLAYVIAKNFLEKFGGDNLEDVKIAYKSYIKRISL